MLKTYTFFLREASPNARFEPGHCEDDADALAHGRSLLEHDRKIRAVDIFFGDRFLLTLGQVSGEG